MQELVQTLWELAKAERVPSGDLVIGSEIQNLYLLLKSDAEIPEKFEDLLLALITSNRANLSKTNAHFIALCCIIYYRKQKPSNYWKFIPFITDEIRKHNVTAIIILGLMSRRLCDGFKSQLHTPIGILLSCGDDHLLPVICQCFRRIIKGTGTFLIGSIPEIFGFVFCGASSTNELLRVECVKTLPTLFEHACIPIKKLLPIVGQSLYGGSKILRFAAAKSLAQLVLLGSQAAQEDQKPSGNENPFRYSFRVMLQFAQHERNIPTLAVSVAILLRYYQPIEIVKRLRTFARLVFSLTSLGLSIQSLVFISRAVFQAAVNIAGATAGNAMCHHLFDVMNAEEMTLNKAIVTLTLLTEFDCSTKTIAIAAKQLYPLLAANRKDVKRACIAFFEKIAKTENQLGCIFIDTFASYLSKIDRNRAADIDGFSHAACVLLVLVENVRPKSFEVVQKMASEWICEEGDLLSPCVPAGFLLISALMRKGRGYEYIPRCFNFIQTFLQNVPKLSTNTAMMRKVVKAISIYLYLVVGTLVKGLDQILPTVKGFVATVLPNVAKLSRKGIVVFWKLARLLAGSSDVKLADEMAKVTTVLLPSVLSLDAFVVTRGFEDDTDISGILYGIETPVAITGTLKYKSVSDIIVDDMKTPAETLLNDFVFWISRCSASVCSTVIPPLFTLTKQTVNQIASKLLLVAAILKSDRAIDLPTNFVDVLLGAKKLMENSKMKQVVAYVVAMWMTRYQDSVDGIFRKVAHVGHELAALVFAHYAPNMSDSLAVRSFLILHSIVLTDKDPVEAAFAVSKLVEHHKHLDDLVSCASNLLEQVSFSDILRNHTVLHYFTDCITKIPKVNQQQLQRTAQILTHYGTNRAFTLLSGLRSMKNLNDTSMLQFHFTSLVTPLPILIAGYSYGFVLDDVPLLFTILQQSSDSVVAGFILKAFAQDPDVKKWTDLCKRIVIIGCVPPAERRGDTRIVPTHTVLLCAIRIAVLLVAKIRDTFPSQLSCVDDVVAIAFNAIHMNDRVLDFHCFSILASVIDFFNDVRNREGALLDLYFSQFHPTLVRAVDGNHDLPAIANFVISFYRYMLDNHSALLEEAEQYIAEGLKKLMYNEESLIFFCRIAALIKPKDSQLRQMFSKAAARFLADVCTQNRTLVELKDELPMFIDALPANFPIPFRVILSLLIIQLGVHCDSTILAAITNLQKHNVLDAESISIIVSIIDKSQLMEDEAKPQELEQQPDEDADLDETTFWIIPKKRTSSINTFLAAVAPICTDENWKSLLSLSVRPPVSYVALAKLIMNATEPHLREFGPAVATAVLNNGLTENAFAFLTVLISRLPIDLLDSLIYGIILNQCDTQSKFDVIRMIMKRLNGFDFTSASDLARFISGVLLPDGFMFTASLLVSNDTLLAGLVLINHGVIDSVITSILSGDAIKYLPKILHFLKLVISSLRRLFSAQTRSKFELGVARGVMISLSRIGSVAERGAVVMPARELLSLIDRDILRAAHDADRNKMLIHKAVTPPKLRRVASIQLKAFSDIKTRKTAGMRGWQSLEVDSDESL